MDQYAQLDGLDLSLTKIQRKPNFGRMLLEPRDCRLRLYLGVQARRAETLLYLFRFLLFFFSAKSLCPAKTVGATATTFGG